MSQWGLAARLRHRATPHRTCRPHPRWDPVRLPAHIVAPVSGHPAPFPNVVWDPTEQCKVRNRSNEPASWGGYINQVGTLGSLVVPKEAWGGPLLARDPCLSAHTMVRRELNGSRVVPGALLSRSGDPQPMLFSLPSPPRAWRFCLFSVRSEPKHQTLMP